MLKPLGPHFVAKAETYRKVRLDPPNFRVAREWQDPGKLPQISGPRLLNGLTAIAIAPNGD
jgi:hypothetical protein